MSTFCSRCGNSLDESNPKNTPGFVFCIACQRSTPVGANSYSEKLKGGKMKERKEKKEASAKKRKYGDDINKTILSMAKENKTIKEIAAHFNNHPGKPYISRLIKAEKK